MSEQIDITVLKSLTAFSKLNDSALSELLAHSRIFKLEQNEQLLASAHHDKVFYVLRGSISVEENGRQMYRITAGTARAAEPIFRVHTPGLIATCQQQTLLLCLSKSICSEHAKLESDKTIEQGAISEIEISTDENELLSEIYHAYQSKEVDLPTCPEIALKINKTIQNNNLDISDIAKVVQADPIITARVVQLANSATYFSSRAVSTVKDAITRIGLEATRSVVMSFVMQNLYKPENALIRQRMHELYEHSIEVAAMCHVIARHKRHYDAEHALLAGILHDIGVIPILIMADKHPVLSSDPKLLEKAIQKLHGFIGGLLLQQWGFEKDLVTAAEESDDWLRDPAKHADYCDIVLVAQLHSRFIEGISVSAPPLYEVPAFIKLGLGEIDPEVGVKMLDEAKLEILDLITVLQG